MAEHINYVMIVCLVTRRVQYRRLQKMNQYNILQNSKRREDPSQQRLFSKASTLDLQTSAASEWLDGSTSGPAPPVHWKWYRDLLQSWSSLAVLQIEASWEDAFSWQHGPDFPLPFAQVLDIRWYQMISGLDFIQSSSYCGRCSFGLVSIYVTNGHTRKLQEASNTFRCFGMSGGMTRFHLRTSQAKAALAMWKQMAPEKKRGCARLARV